jgi:putative transposase
MTLVTQAPPGQLPLSQMCRVLGLNRSAVYRRRSRNAGAPVDRSRKKSIQPRALQASEREAILSALTSEEFENETPRAIYHALLQRGIYLASVSSFHRLLRSAGQSGERRNQRPPQHHEAPRLLARGPNEVWTWDITKLPLERRGLYLSLYVVMDLFSRYVVAWMLSRKENSGLATQLMEEALARYEIAPDQLPLHQDRGSPMTATGYLEALRDRKVTCSHSRPRVSNDNAFSESQFKTAKYQPDYPRRFRNGEHARAWCSDYFAWYNTAHHHSGLGGFTPEQVFTGTFRDVAMEKQRALDAIYGRHPERFVKGRPLVELPPSTVAINPVPLELVGTIDDRVNFPTLPALREPPKDC